MSKKIFFGKQKNDDRDCCIYIERPEFECGHYFSKPHPEGACYSCSWEGFNKDEDEYAYENIETVLTKKEYTKFRKLIKELDSFGCGLDKDEEKKKVADSKAEELNKFIDDYLLSAKAKAFAEKIKQGEIEFMKEEYDFDDEDIENIYDYYGGEYFDRAMIGRIYNDYYEVAEEYMECGCGDISSFVENYIDYDRMGEDLVSDGDYVELSDGRIVEYNC